jgi:resuscitation-promoting factor RpfA
VSLPVNWLRRGALVSALIGALFAGLAGVAAADPSPETWAALRMCEASGRYDAVADNGHYGAYQFDLATWRSVGGTGNPAQASPAEQDARALALYHRRGWQPWECAGMLGLREDADAGRGGPLPVIAEPAAPTIPVAPAFPGRVLTPGMCDTRLVAWQQRMNAFGYDFQGTGCYGAETAAAVAAVRKANKLPAASRVDAATWAAAWTGASPTGAPAHPDQVLARGDCDPALRAWQLRMGERGMPFRGTGCFGDLTAQAVTRLQSDAKLPATGVLDPATWLAAWTQP